MSYLPKGPSIPLLQFVRWMAWPTEFLEDCVRRFGNTFTVKIPNYPTSVFFSNPKDIRQIFTADPEDVYAGEANAGVIEAFVGPRSLLFLDGKKHLRERKLMMPPFHGERMKEYGTIMRDITNSVINAWPEHSSFPLHPSMQKITLEVILHAVFGVEEIDKQTQLRKLLTTVMDTGSSPLLLMVGSLLSPENLNKLLRIGSKPVSLWQKKKLDLSWMVPWNKLSKDQDLIDQILYEEIARKQSEKSEEHTDILSMLVKAKDEDGNPMSKEELRDEMMTLLAAGHETTATSLAWAFHHILANPKVLNTVLEEIASVIDNDSIEAEHVGKLVYLDAAIKESMRLNPIIPVVGRKLKRPMRIGNYDLPKDIVVIPCIYLTHHDPTIWPEPKRFLPERFLDKRPNPYEFFPFGGGVRRCIGMAFALFEMKIVLAQTFLRMNLQKAPEDQVTLARRGITFAPSSGVKVIASHRKTKNAPLISQAHP